MIEEVSLAGPVEEREGRLVLLIPLEAGGSALVECAKGIAEVEGEYLKVEVPAWLAGVLHVEAGDIVIVGNAGGKFCIRPVQARPVH